MTDDDRGPAPATRKDVESRLAEIRASRGYLLPHHGLLAVAAPELLDAYDATYSALTLGDQVLDDQAKEFVWLTIEVSKRDSKATHHIRRWRDAGGDDLGLEAAFKLAAYAHGAGVFPFVDENWRPHLLAYHAERVYRDGVKAIIGGADIAPGWVEMALAAFHVCHRQWWAFEVHLRGAYAIGVDESELAEALALTMFPGGVANFVEACARWRQMILAGNVAATEPYRAWAETPDQDGYAPGGT